MDLAASRSKEFIDNFQNVLKYMACSNEHTENMILN